MLERLGPYKIGRKLGRGGMGTVYAGVDENGRTAAIKVLAPNLAMEEGFRDRFEIEIETLKKLNHPSIVRLYGWGEQEGHLYYVMELVEGTNLEEELHRGRRFDWHEVTRFGIELCKALKHAHDRGVIHRDIKPANIMLTPDGEIKLSDFGIARLFGNTRLTADGGLIGTAEYMSPEQAEGKRVSHHCDLYSLGAVLYALLAGRPPFRSQSLVEMLQMQRFSEPTPIRRLVPEVPEEMERIIGKLLEKSPENRPPNAAILGKQLAAMEHGLAMMAREEPTAAPAAESSDFTLTAGNAAATQATGVLDPLGETRVVDEPSPPSSVNLGETSAVISAEPAQPAAPRVPAPNRFMTIEEAAKLEAERETGPGAAPVVIQVFLLASCLVAIVLVLWYFFRAPSADQLYARVEAVAASEDPERLHEAEDDIQDFLTRFPDDPRAATLTEYQAEIELARQQRRLQRQGRVLRKDASMSPLERDYYEALREAELDPQRSAIKLQAIVDLYGDNDQADENTRQAVELARRQLATMKPELEKLLPERLKLIDGRLAKADALRQSDAAAARSVYQDIVTLYADKTWAADRVQQAQSALANMPEKSAVGSR